MKAFKKFFLAALVFLIFATGIWLGLNVTRLMKPGGLRETNTPIIVQQVQTLADLVTVKYVLQKVEIVDSPPSSTLGQFVQGDDRVLLLAQGIVKAGIDLRKISADDVNISNKSITIKLPQPQVTDAYLDDAQTKVIERTTGFLRSLDKDLEQKTRQTALDDIRRAAQENGILNDANDRARLQLKTFFLQMGFTDVQFH